ncbi:asparaginase [Aneurinibacillus sp. Ricciae_BoGa-3]|uniref:asparaginase n=1 Tax=Aneurinibacillus sp. Ricciae_BoGa-3 TaxID=3022697 RepID=UPI00234035D0|nr:asparaginase [Aneurinibacillus sp. Ricciae_BoGa-3]WCK56770.1 asparaginase [Aneurinibacillus sp. Ricciae_BoGa-3]
MAAKQENPKKIIIFNTGGTIAMEVDESTDSVRPGEKQPLHTIEPMLSRYAAFEMIDLFNMPSPHVTPADMLALARQINEYATRPDTSGFVVTHGTDTLEETAYFLDLTIATNKPVVITGAMRSSNELGADGPVNLIQSVRVASSSESKGRGALVVFNDEIHAAKYVTKTHTSNVATFQSPQVGPVGTITKKTVSYSQPPAVRTQPFEIHAASRNVPLIKMVTGMDPAWFLWLLQQKIDGLVVEAFGAGNVPPAILPIFEQLTVQGVPIVMVSRCYNGYVQDLYGYEGGGKQLKKLGIIFCNGLNGQKARIKLIVALEAGVSETQLAELF